MTNKIGFQIGGDYFKNDDYSDPSLPHDILDMNSPEYKNR